jgi:hypothetical protein
VQVHVEGDEAAVDLSEGNLSLIAGTGNASLRSGGNTVIVAAGGVVSAGVSFSAADGGTADGAGGGADGIADGAGDLRVRVIQGNAAMTGQNAQGGQSVVREAAAGGMLGAGTERNPSVIVLDPPPNARLNTTANAPLNVTFRWNKVNFSASPALAEQETVRLDIAANRNFSRIVNTTESGGNSASVPLAPGVYFWRAYPAGNPARYVGEAQTGKLTIAYNSPPELLRPAEGYVYTYRTRIPAVQFQWNFADSSGNDTPVLLEAANNPQFNNPAISVRVRGSSLQSSALGEGRWYWRLTPFYGSEAGTPTRAGSFTVSRSVSFPPPLLVNPPAGKIVNKEASENFSWRASGEAASYTLRISPNRDLSNPLITKTGRDTYFADRTALEKLGEGIYYWGVFYTSPEGTDSPLSEVRDFNALAGELIQRLVFPPDTYTAAAVMLPDIRFTWKTNLPWRTRFQISRTEDFSSYMVNEVVTGESFQGRHLPEGNYWWRLRAEQGNGRFIDTPPRRFVSAPPLPEAVMESPATVMVIDEGESMDFRWRTVPGADYYRFRLFGPGGQLLYDYPALNAAGLSLPLTADGNYTWTVQAFAAEGRLNSRRTGLLATRQINLRIIRPFPAPLNRLPANGFTADLEYLRENRTIRFSWDPVAGANRYILRLYLERAGRREAIFTGFITENSYTLEDLTLLNSGRIYWELEAVLVNSAGEIEQPGIPGENNFTVDIPLPSVPRLREGALYGTENNGRRRRR